jgi:hypothetical protein
MNDHLVLNGERRYSKWVIKLQLKGKVVLVEACDMPRKVQVRKRQRSGFFQIPVVCRNQVQLKYLLKDFQRWHVISFKLLGEADEHFSSSTYRLDCCVQGRLVWLGRRRWCCSLWHPLDDLEIKWVERQAAFLICQRDIY